MFGQQLASEVQQLHAGSAHLLVSLGLWLPAPHAAELEALGIARPVCPGSNALWCAAAAATSGEKEHQHPGAAPAEDLRQGKDGEL